MNTAILALFLVLAPALADAKIINVEFKFTPYTGEPAKADEVKTVPGRAEVFINAVPYADQDVRAEAVPVIFEEREIAPSLWIPVELLGPAVRKGKNSIRIVFTPAVPEQDYRAQFSWTTVTDQGTHIEEDGAHKSTNTQGSGKEDKAGKGPIIFEREFTADFAADLPWHHYPIVTTLSDDDKQKLTALVEERGAALKPNFKSLYSVLAGNKRVDLVKIKKAKCVDAAYAAGVRLDAPTADQLEFITTGNPEVVIRRKGGNLFMPADPSAFEKIKGEETQMCAGIALSMAFPARLGAVRAPDGAWQLAY